MHRAGSPGRHCRGTPRRCHLPVIARDPGRQAAGNQPRSRAWGKSHDHDRYGGRCRRDGAQVGCANPPHFKVRARAMTALARNRSSVGNFHGVRLTAISIKARIRRALPVRFFWMSVIRRSIAPRPGKPPMHVRLSSHLHRQFDSCRDRRLPARCSRGRTRARLLLSGQRGHARHGADGHRVSCRRAGGRNNVAAISGRLPPRSLRC